MSSSLLANPEKILKDLRNQWAQIGHEQSTNGGILRACAMTLIIVADHPEESDQVRQATGLLMHAHPNRTIVLYPREDAELNASVFAECWKPFGGGPQICAEGVEITTDLVESGDVARLLVPLIAPDLPVTLWCRGRRPFLERSFDPLFALAGKIIFDSRTARHVPSAIEFMGRLRRTGKLVGDLAWTGLTGWREMIAQVFDDHALQASAIRSARVVYAGEKSGSDALYFGRWLERSLRGVDVRLEQAPAEERAKGLEPGVFAVALTGDGVDVETKLASGSCLAVRVGSRTQFSARPPSSEAQLIDQELSFIGPDAVFDRVLM
jgi:glucose-6-phosphate dehydrogenase assembly protein OpcA